MKKKLLAITIVLLMVFGIATKKADAAASSKTLQLNTTYSVKLSGANKKLKITNYRDREGYISKYNFHVNDKQVNSYSLGNYSYEDYGERPLIKLLNLKNKKSYIWISYDRGGGEEQQDYIFEYKNGIFSKCLHLLHFPGFTSWNQEWRFCEVCNVENITVSGNSMKLSYGVSTWHWNEMKFIDTYVYKSGTLKKASNNLSSFKLYNGDYKLATTIKAKKAVTTYKTAGGSKAYYTISKGASVKVKGLWSKSNKVYLKVVYKNKTGWISMMKTEGFKAFYKFTDV